MVRHLKYQGWLHLAGVCAESMAGSIGSGELDALVPVPLHPVRRRARGYNQAHVLADALGELSGLPVVDALRRTRATRPQVGLGRSARAANVAGAFVCRSTPPAAIGVVDDVTTSGATLAEAADALFAAGARSVLGLAYALAPEGASG